MLDEQGHVIALVDEEYGFKLHWWHTGMVPDDLEQFWSSIAKMADCYLKPSAMFPGQWKTASNPNDEARWTEAFNSKKFYYAHVHWEDDSHLRTPDGRILFHAGYIK